MIYIDIKYRPVSFLPWKRKIKVSLPIKYRELTPSQFISVVNFRSGLLQDVEIFSIFLSIPLKIAKQIPQDQTEKILRYLAYLKVNEPIDFFFIREIYQAECPKPGLEDLKLGKMLVTDLFYSNYLKGKEEDLDKLIPCLYTDWIKINEPVDDLYLEFFEGIDKNLKEAIALNFEMIKLWIVKSYPYLFNFLSKIESQSDSKNWLDSYYLFCEGKQNLFEWSMKQNMRYIFGYLNLFQKFYNENPGNAEEVLDKMNQYLIFKQ